MQHGKVNIEQIFGDSLGDNKQREQELVLKYNELLTAAKKLREENSHLETSNRENVKIILKMQEQNSIRKDKNIIGYCVSAFIAGMVTVVVIGKDRQSDSVVASTYTPPTTISTESTNAGIPIPDNNNTTPNMKSEIPTVVRRFSFKYGMISNATGKSVKRDIIVMSDGAITDSVYGKLQHVSDDLYKNVNGNSLRFEEINAHHIILNGSDTFTDDSASTNLTEIAEEFKEANARDIANVTRKGGDSYLTYANGEFVQMYAFQDKLIYVDINGYGEFKTYIYSTMDSDSGNMVYTKQNSNKYIKIGGVPLYTSNNNMNNVINSFRGNPVVKLN